MNNMHIKKWIKTGAVVALWALPLVAAAQTLDVGINYGTATGLGTKDLRDTVVSIINVGLGLLGLIAVVIMLAGGFTWMTAAGNEEKVDKAKKMIFAGIIGLAIILSAYAISRFVITNLITATGGVQ